MFQTTNQNISQELLVANYLPAGLPSRSTSPSSNIPVESFIGLELAEAIRNIEHDIAILFSMVFSLFSHELRCVFHVFSNLVGGITTPSEKYEFVNGKDDIPYIIPYMKRKIIHSCFKPPTSYVFPVRFLHQRFPVRFRHPPMARPSL